MKKTVILMLSFSFIMFLFSCGNTENKTNNTKIDEVNNEKTEEVKTEEQENKTSVEVKIQVTKEEIIAIMGNDFTESKYEEEMTYAKVTELKYGEDAIVNIINSKVYSIVLFSDKYSFGDVKVGDNAKIALKVLSNSYENEKDRFSDEVSFDKFTNNEIKIFLNFDIGNVSESELTDEAKISQILVSDTYERTL